MAASCEHARIWCHAIQTLGLTGEISKGVDALLWAVSLCVLKISVLLVANPLRCTSWEREAGTAAAAITGCWAFNATDDDDRALRA